MSNNAFVPFSNNVQCIHSESNNFYYNSIVKRSNKTISGKNLTDVVSEFKEDNIYEFKKLLGLVTKLKIRSVESEDLLMLKQEYHLRIPDYELFSFFNRISDYEEDDGVLIINDDLFRLSQDRLNQRLKLLSTDNSKPEVVLKERELIDYITDLESNDGVYLILSNITRDIYNTFEKLIKNIDDYFGNTQINDKIIMDVDDIKAKLKEIQVYTKNLSSKSYEKYEMLLLLRDYISTLKHDVKNYEQKIKHNYDNNIPECLNSEKSQEYVTQIQEEYNKLLEEREYLHNIIIETLENEKKELLDMYVQQEKDVELLKDELNKEILTLKIEREHLQNINYDYKREIDILTEKRNAKENEEEDLLLSENELLEADQHPLTEIAMKFPTEDDEQFNILKNVNEMAEPNPKALFQDIIHAMHVNKKDNHHLFNEMMSKELNEEQKNYLIIFEDNNKSLTEKIAGLEKSQNFYDQKIFIMNKERLKENLHLDKNDTHLKESEKNSICHNGPIHTLEDLSVGGNDSINKLKNEIFHLKNQIEENAKNYKERLKDLKDDKESLLSKLTENEIKLKKLHDSEGENKSLTQLLENAKLDCSNKLFCIENENKLLINKIDALEKDISSSKMMASKDLKGIQSVDNTKLYVGLCLFIIFVLVKCIFA